MDLYEIRQKHRKSLTFNNNLFSEFEYIGASWIDRSRLYSWSGAFGVKYD